MFGCWHPIISVGAAVQPADTRQACPMCLGTGEMAVALPCDLCGGEGKVDDEVIKRWRKPWSL